MKLFPTNRAVGLVILHLLLTDHTTYMYFILPKSIENNWTFFWSRKKSKFVRSLIAEKYENRFKNLKNFQERYVIGKFHGEFRDQQGG